MRSIGQITASEARERFAEVLSLVEAGETIEITRHGVVIARISHAHKPVLSTVPDMDNSALWKLSEGKGQDKSKNLTERLRDTARY
jgi:prevent-host-death family protein